MRFALPILLMACILMIQCAAAYAQERGLPPGSGLYYKWLKGCVNGVEEDIPSITASASAAAAKFVLEDFQIGAWGDTAFISEFTGRAGGLMPVTPVSDKDTALAGRIILVPLDDDSLAERIARIAAFKAQGNMVIVFGRKSVLQEANKLGGAWDFAVENHAAPHGGLLKGEDGKWYVPTDGTANIVALWAWTGEFVGACRRLGKMPAMWQSIGVPGSKERNDRYRKLRYDEGVFVTPSAPGVVGRGYMRALRIGLGNVFEKESPAIQKASGALVSALKGNCNLYLLPLGHALSAQKDGGNCDPGFFKHWSAKNSVAAEV